MNQTCKKCNASWEVSVTVEKCPFCGEILLKMQRGIINNLSDLLSTLFHEYGTDIMKQQSRMISLCSDYAPNLTREIKLLKSALGTNIASLLTNAMEGDRNIQMEALMKCKSRLCDELMWVEAYAVEFLNSIANAMLWQVELEKAEEKATTQDEEPNLRKSDVSSEAEYRYVPLDYVPRSEPSILPPSMTDTQAVVNSVYSEMYDSISFNSEEAKDIWNNLTNIRGSIIKAEKCFETISALSMDLYSTQEVKDRLINTQYYEVDMLNRHISELLSNITVLLRIHREGIENNHLGFDRIERKKGSTKSEAYLFEYLSSRKNYLDRLTCRRTSSCDAVAHHRLIDELLSEIITQKNQSEIMEKYANLCCGQEFQFGIFTYSGDITEPITWIVLENDGCCISAISKYGLDVRCYNEYSTATTWRDCTLRKWLNEDFFISSFSKLERDAIVSKLCENSNNPEYHTRGGDQTQDKVYLLSIEEVEKFFASSREREIELTPFAINKGQEMDLSDFAPCWWLRSPGEKNDCAAAVYFNDAFSGMICSNGFSVEKAGIVRPVIDLRIC